MSSVRPSVRFVVANYNDNDRGREGGREGGRGNHEYSLGVITQSERVNYAVC